MSIESAFLIAVMLGSASITFLSWCLLDIRKQVDKLTRNLDAIIQEARDPKAIAEKATPLAEHGANQHKEEVGLDNIKSSTAGGTSASYLTARIARDCPEVLERLTKNCKE